MKITNRLVLRAFGFRVLCGNDPAVTLPLRVWVECAWWRIKAMFGGKRSPTS